MGCIDCCRNIFFGNDLRKDINVLHESQNITVQATASASIEPKTTVSPSTDDHQQSEFDLSTIPVFDGSTSYVEVDGNIPYFTAEDISKGTTSFESYSELDSLERCGVAHASVGQDLMPTEERGSIGMIKPSGWHTVRYDDLIPDGKYLYNRCHLIGYQLTGENANKQNLVTGTRYMNVTGMEPFENMTTQYIKNTDNE